MNLAKPCNGRDEKSDHKSETSQINLGSVVRSRSPGTRKYRDPVFLSAPISPYPVFRLYSDLIPGPSDFGEMLLLPLRGNRAAAFISVPGAMFTRSFKDPGRKRIGKK